jgi:tetratricopeptide (TPR) repeat protein
LDGLPIGAGMANRSREALTDVEEAVRLDSRNGRAQLRLASLLETAKRYAEALGAVDQALQYEQFSDWIPPATWQRARILRALGRGEEAVTAAQGSLRLAWRANPGFLNHQLQRLALRGYWLEPESEDQFEKTLDDAATACMADEQCW